MTVNFLTLDDDEDVVFGTITLEDGVAVARPTESEGLQEIAAKVNEEIKRIGDPEKVMRHLPKHYKSAYLRAEIVEDRCGKDLVELLKDNG